MVLKTVFLTMVLKTMTFSNNWFFFKGLGLLGHICLYIGLGLKNVSLSDSQAFDLS